MFAGMSLSTYLLAVESIGPSWRGAAGIATQCTFQVGMLILLIMAVLFDTWRSMSIACGVVTLAALLILPLLPESGRYNPHFRLLLVIGCS